MIRAHRAQAVTREALPALVSPCHAPSLAIWVGASQNRAFLAELPGLRLLKQKNRVSNFNSLREVAYLLKLPLFVSSPEIISMGVKLYDRLPAGPRPIRTFNVR
jgi:hypothetical protein